MCRSLKTFFTRDVILLCVAFVMLVVTLIPALAHAELKAARDLQKLPSGATGYFEVSAAKAADLPVAYLMWSEDAASFWLRRGTAVAGTYETLPMEIPDGQPFTMPAPPAYYSGGVWTHKIEMTPSGADSVCCLPLDR